MKPGHTLENLRTYRREDGGGALYFPNGELIVDVCDGDYFNLIHEAVKTGLAKPAEERGPEVGDIVAYVFKRGTVIYDCYDGQPDYPAPIVVLMRRAEAENHIRRALAGKGE